MSERLEERLRRAARTYRRLGNHTAEGMFLEAADTICELQTDNAKLRESVKRLMTQRDERLASAEAENAKLRERCHYLMKGDLLHVLTDQEYIDQCERERLMQVSIDALDKENAKLRELVRDYIDAPCTTCDCWQDEFRCWNYDGADCGLVARARELGVEVDE